MTPIQHTLVCGATRSGKSEAELSRLVPLARANDCAVVLLDPPGSLAQKFLLHLDSLGLTHRVVYDRLSDTDLVPGYDWLSPSAHPDPLQRQAEDDERVREFAAVLLRRRGIQDTAATPLIEEGILAVLRLFLRQRTPVPLHWLAEAFTIGSEHRNRLLSNCTEPELLRKFDAYARLSPTARRTETGPAERVLRAVCESPAFHARSGQATFDLGRFLDGRGILILDGSSRGNLSRDAASVMMGGVLLRVIQHGRTGGHGRVVLVLDEAVNANLIGIHESRALAEAGKWGLEFHLVVQDPFNFPSEEIRRNVLQNSHHEWFRQGGPEAARLAAEDIATPVLDLLRVHHTEYRVRTVDVGYERVPTSSTTERTSPDGRASGSSRTRGSVLWPRRREVRDAQDRYTTLNDQILLMQKELMCLQPGYRLVRGAEAVPEYVPMLTSPWGQDSRVAEGGAGQRFSDHKLVCTLAAMRNRPMFRPLPFGPASPSAPPSPAGAARRLAGR